MFMAQGSPQADGPLRSVIVIGGSAGALDPLLEIARALPPDLAAAVLVVLHLPGDYPSLLPELLNRAGPLAAAHAVDGEQIRMRRIYVAPPNRHLLVRLGRLRLSAGPRENRHRPAVDPLFRSAASTYGPRTAAVILSGLMDDGSLGLAAVAEGGGATIVQDPATALCSEMPANALRAAPRSQVLTAAQIGPALAQMAGTAALEQEESLHHPGAGSPATTSESEWKGESSSGFSCPQCSGVLAHVAENGHGMYKCRVGHLFSPSTLADEYAQATENNLWQTLRAMREQADLIERRRHDELDPALVKRCQAQQEWLRRATAMLQQLLDEGLP